MNEQSFEDEPYYLDENGDRWYYNAQARSDAPAARFSLKVLPELRSLYWSFASGTVFGIALTVLTVALYVWWR